MRTIKRRAALAALGAAAGTLFAGTALAQQTMTLRLHQMLPPQATIPAKAIVPWAQKVEAESGGRIKIQLFHAMQLGGAPPQLFDQARFGVFGHVRMVFHRQDQVSPPILGQGHVACIGARIRACLGQVAGPHGAHLDARPDQGGPLGHDFAPDQGTGGNDHPVTLPAQDFDHHIFQPVNRAQGEDAAICVQRCCRQVGHAIQGRLGDA